MDAPPVDAPRVISYFTLGTGYEEEARRLRRSLEALGIRHNIVGIESRGSWQRNCNYKPDFILSQIELSGPPLLWLDADAEVLVMPWFDLGAADIGYVERTGPDGRPEIQASLLWVRRTHRTRAFLRDWASRCREDPRLVDQGHLNRLLAPGEFWARELARVLLPWETITFPEEPDGFIRMHQASRRLAREAGYEPPPPFRPGLAG